MLSLIQFGRVTKRYTVQFSIYQATRRAKPSSRNPFGKRSEMIYCSDMALTIYGILCWHSVVNQLIYRVYKKNVKHYLQIMLRAKASKHTNTQKNTHGHDLSTICRCDSWVPGRLIILVFILCHRKELYIYIYEFVTFRIQYIVFVKIPFFVSAIFLFIILPKSRTT